MKWWFLFFMRGLAVGGPYDTEQDCLAALKVEIARPIMDQGFDNAKADGLCFQASRPAS
jgi:hypothetical protein